MIALGISPDLWGQIQIGLELLAGAFWIVLALIDFKNGNKKAWLDVILAGLFFGASLLSVKIDRIESERREGDEKRFGTVTNDLAQTKEQLAKSENTRTEAVQAASNAVVAANRAKNSAADANATVSETRPRSMTPEQQAKLVKLLEDCPKGKFMFNLDPLVSDAQNLAAYIGGALQKSGFEYVGFDRMMVIDAGPPIQGIQVGVYGEPTNAIVNTLVAAFNSVGIPARKGSGNHRSPNVVYIDIRPR